MSDVLSKKTMFSLGSIGPLLLLLPTSGDAKDKTFEVPKFKAPVVDAADIIDEATETYLNYILKDVWVGGGSQIGILTVKSLSGFSVEEASLKVAETWKLGDAKRDDGVLLFIAKDDHQLRIEVGQGKEGDLPDAYARRIIDEVIVPEFKVEQMSHGIQEGIFHILTHTDPEWMKSQREDPRIIQDRNRGLSSEETVAATFAFFVIVALLIGLSWLWNRFCPKWLRSSGSGPGSRSRASYSSSRSSGGGFSGGGASGRW